MEIEHFKKIKELIKEAETNGLLYEAKGLTGLSGNKLVGTLQRLSKYIDSIDAGCYLEIGVFQGLTLISAACTMQSKAFGIDNFKQFDPDKTNQKLIEERIKLNNLDNVQLINQDYEDALDDLSVYLVNEEIGLYFIDGPHDYRSQLVCLLHAERFLSQYSVIIIDDCNYRHVRLATQDFLKSNSKFKLIFEAYTSSHPANADSETEKTMKDGWWNGVNILVYDPNDLLETEYPPTLRDRLLFENDAIIHSMKYPNVGPQAVSFFSSLFDFKLISAFKSFVVAFKRRLKISHQLKGKHKDMNTFSDKLTTSRFNKTI